VTLPLIYDARERFMVRVFDAALAPLKWFGPNRRQEAVQRVLLLRLERIGDLLMTLDAIHDARRFWPEARIDLAVGAWNAQLAELIPGLARVHVVSVPWLARDSAGDSWRTLIATARRWRTVAYDVIVNFEPDVRTNFLTWIAGGRTRFGYESGGGGAFLSHALRYDVSTHSATNARRLIAHASESQSPKATSHEEPTPRLVVPDSARQRARELLGGAGRPLVGLHVSGGRPSKQWHLDRFAEAGRQVAERRGATLVLTGSVADRPLIDAVRVQLGSAPVVDVAGVLDVVGLAALLSELDVFITGDTGPMHVAAAMGTPLVSLFGPSNPVRYGPLATRAEVLRVDLPCSPCGRVRLPPERCRGHVPDCLDSISTDRVVHAALAVLDGTPGALPSTAR
jgi:ADP-heptose:LPS heptosyltransferase